MPDPEPSPMRLRLEERVNRRIELGFGKIDPRWRDIDPGQSTPRVTFSWSRHQGEIRLDVRGTAVTSLNLAKFNEVILSAIRAELTDSGERDADRGEVRTGAAKLRY